MSFNKNKKFIFGGIAFLLLCNFFAWQAVYHSNQAGFLEVIFFDVGQGDSILIKSAEGHYILIDGGPSPVILDKLAQEIPFWQKEIDLIALTHAHDDHFAGLTDVLQRYEVEKVLWSGVAEDSAGFRKWKSSVLESETELKIVWAGWRISGQDFFIEVLHPFFSLAGLEFKDVNLSSLVLRLVFNENSFLFMGDAYQSTERELIEREANISADVLMVGHHGSKTSTAKDFIETVLPKIAVISCGRDNQYGHPHQATLDTLKKYDITILRTDERGDIRIFSNGENLKIKY